MTLHLVFQTLAEANNAIATINVLMGYPRPDRPNGRKGTQTYAEPWERYQIGGWVFPKPEDQYMVGVFGYTIEEYLTSWRPPSGIGS